MYNNERIENAAMFASFVFFCLSYVGALIICAHDSNVGVITMFEGLLGSALLYSAGMFVDMAVSLLSAKEGN